MAPRKEDRTTPVTPWFPGSEKPARRGVYQRQFSTGKTVFERFCYWSGQYWYMSDTTPDRAMEWVQSGPAARQSLPWRGVMK